MHTVHQEEASDVQHHPQVRGDRRGSWGPRPRWRRDRWRGRRPHVLGTPSSGTTPTQAPAARPQRQALSSDVAAKVKAAAVEKVPGATVLRAESGGPYPSAYHAHITKSDGTLAVALVNTSFEATALQADE